MNPGEVVTHIDLAAAVDPDFFNRAGGTNVAQLVTYIRTMFNEAMDKGHLSEESLQQVLEMTPYGASTLKKLTKVSRRVQLRILIENVRNVGYTLHLPPSEILLERL